MTEEWEQDALKELFNMSLGRGVAALSEMVDDEIAISVPQIHAVDRTHLLQRLNLRVQSGDNIVGMPFRLEFDRTPIEGLALISFPQQDSLSILEALVGRPIPPEALPHIQAGAMREMGDLFLYTCASSFSHFLDAEIVGEEVSFTRVSATTMVNLLPCGLVGATNREKRDSDRFVELEVGFHAQTRSMHGRLCLLLEVNDALPLHAMLKGFMEKHLG